MTDYKKVSVWLGLIVVVLGVVLITSKGGDSQSAATLKGVSKSATPGPSEKVVGGPIKNGSVNIVAAPGTPQLSLLVNGVLVTTTVYQDVITSVTGGTPFNIQYVANGWTNNCTANSSSYTSTAPTYSWYNTSLPQINSLQTVSITEASNTVSPGIPYRVVYTVFCDGLDPNTGAYITATREAAIDVL